MNVLKESQTTAINALRDYFYINESDIPCLVFTKLGPYNYDHPVIQVVPITGNNVYGYFKKLFNKINPLLIRYKNILSNLKELAKQIKDLKIKSEQNPFKPECEILELRKQLLLYAEKDIVDENGCSLLDCVNNLSYGKFDKPLRSMLNRYIDWVKNYEKRTGRPFDGKLVQEDVCQSADALTQIKTELSTLEYNQDKLGETCNNILCEIESIIGESKMTENINRDNKSSIFVTGDNTQIIYAPNSNRVEATQNIECNKKELMEFIEKIRKALPTDISADDIKDVNESLEVIEDEIKKIEPCKSFLKMALKSLQAIKGTVEFGSAVAALVQFIQPIL